MASQHACAVPAARPLAAGDGERPGASKQGCVPLPPQRGAVRAGARSEILTGEVIAITEEGTTRRATGTAAAMTCTPGAAWILLPPGTRTTGLTFD